MTIPTVARMSRYAKGPHDGRRDNAGYDSGIPRAGGVLAYPLFGRDRGLGAVAELVGGLAAVRAVPW